MREYRIEEVLGVGGFGITYLAKHENFREKYVAIKEYLPAVQAYRGERSEVRLLSSGDASVFEWGLDRFFEEANNLHGLRHPSIVTVENVFKENGTAYMVMDVVQGVSTADLAGDKEVLSEEALWGLFDQLASALDTIHGQDLIHRDITPSNILYRREDERAVLIDFGSSRQQLEKTQLVSGTDHTRIFTPGYAPLEQHEGTVQDHRSDIYGLAASLYHVALHLRPAAAAMRAGADRNQQPDPLVPASVAGQGRYSDALLAMIDRGLALLPQDRPMSVRAWAEESGRTLPEPATVSTRRPATQGRPVTKRPAPPRSDALGKALSFLPASNALRAGIGVAAVFALLLLGHLVGWVDLPGLTSTERLLGRAGEALAEDPMSPASVAASSEYFTKAKLLSGERALVDRSRAGENLCQTITAFQDAVAQGELVPAIDAHQRATELAQVAQVPPEVMMALDAVLNLENQFESVLGQLRATTLRTGELNRLRDSASQLTEAMAAVREPDPDRLSAATTAFEAVRSAGAAAAAFDFEDAAAALARATAALAPFGATALRPAEAQLAAARASYVEEQLRQAQQGVLGQPANSAALAQAAQQIERGRFADPSSRQAQLWAGVVQELQSALRKIDQGQPDEARAAVSRLGGSAKQLGIADREWAQVALSYDNSGVSRALDDALTVFTDTPDATAARQGLFEELAEAQQFAARRPVTTVLAGRIAGLEQLRDALKGSDGHREAHRYDDAAAVIDALGEPLTGWPGGVQARGAVQASIAQARATEAGRRREALLAAVQGYRLPASRQSLLEGMTALQAVDAQNESVARVGRLVNLLERAQTQVENHSYADAATVLSSLAQEASALSLSPSFIQAQRTWLTSEGQTHGTALLAQGFATLAERPLSGAALAEFSEQLAAIRATLNAAGGDLSEVALTEAEVPSIQALAQSSLSGSFEQAEAQFAALEQALSPLTAGYDRWLQAAAQALSKRRANFRTELHLTVTDGLDKSYLGLRREPLDGERLDAAGREFTALEELAQSVDPSAYDWATMRTAATAYQALVQAKALAEEQLDYLQATKSLVKANLSLGRSSRWRRVLETARTDLEGRKNAHVARLLKAAGEMLVVAPLEATARSEALTRYQEVLQIEQSDVGEGQRGVAFVEFLNTHGEALAAGATDRLDEPAIAAAGRDFEPLPGASETVRALRAGIAAEIGRQDQAGLAALTSLVENTQGVDGAALTRLGSALDDADRDAGRRRWPLTQAAAAQSRTVTEQLVEAAGLIAQRRYNSANDVLKIARAELASDALPEPLGTALKALRKAQREVTQNFRVRRLTQYNKTVEGAVDRLGSAPLDSQVQAEVRGALEEVLSEHAEFDTALRVREILDRLASIDEAQPEAACTAAQASSTVSGAIRYPLDWGWLEGLLSRFCAG
ncbi:MAG: serine/threonine-protein kinase [Pseudomonadota bacterium]